MRPQRSGRSAWRRRNGTGKRIGMACGGAGGVEAQQPGAGAGTQPAEHAARGATTQGGRREGGMASAGLREAWERLRTYSREYLAKRREADPAAYWEWRPAHQRAWYQRQGSKPWRSRGSATVRIRRKSATTPTLTTGSTPSRSKPHGTSTTRRTRRGSRGVRRIGSKRTSSARPPGCRNAICTALRGRSDRQTSVPRTSSSTGPSTRRALLGCEPTSAPPTRCCGHSKEIADEPARWTTPAATRKPARRSWTDAAARSGDSTRSRGSSTSAFAFASHRAGRTTSTLPLPTRQPGRAPVAD